MLILITGDVVPCLPLKKGTRIRVRVNYTSSRLIALISGTIAIMAGSGRTTSSRYSCPQPVLEIDVRCAGSFRVIAVLD